MALCKKKKIRTILLSVCNSVSDLLDIKSMHCTKLAKLTVTNLLYDLNVIQNLFSVHCGSQEQLWFGGLQARVQQEGYT